MKLLDSKWVLTDTLRYWRLHRHSFQASQNFASSLFPLPPLPSSSSLCQAVWEPWGQRKVEMNYKGFVRRIARMRHWIEMFAWKDFECLVRVGLQELRERWEEAAAKGLCQENKNLVR